MRFIIRLLVSALSLILATKIIPGIEISGLYSALVVALILGLLNAVVRPALVFLTFPITVITLGLFIFVINAGLFFFVASFVNGFYVAGFWSALFGSIVVSIITGIAYKLDK